MDTWREVPGVVKKEALHSLGILIPVFFHSLLFLGWLGLHHLAERLCDSSDANGFNDYCVQGFRWAASIGILLIAVFPIFSDVAEAFGAFLRKLSWSLRCKTCPVRTDEHA